MKNEILYKSKFNLALGEGIFWNSKIKKFNFVDIYKKKIFFFDPKTKKTNFIKLKKKISFIFPIDLNNYLLGLSTGVYIYDVQLKKYKLIESTKIKSKYERTNDAAISSDGQLYYTILDERKKKKGKLILLKKNLKIEILYNNLVTPNGPLFLNSKTYLFTDSSKKKIFIVKKNKKKIFIKFNKDHPSPDGMTLDQKGLIYISLYGGSRILVYNKKAVFHSEIKLPAKYITNCKFLGNTSKLLVTSASKKIMKKKFLRDEGKFFLLQTFNKGLRNNQLRLKI